MQKWNEKLASDNILEKVTAKRFISVFQDAKPLKEFNVDIYFKLVEKIVVVRKGC